MVLRLSNNYAAPTLGYGDQINKDNSYEPIVQYIDTHFERYLQEELKINRDIPNYHDTRIHACLYFLSPTGHSIKSLDLVTMKALDRKVGEIVVVVVVVSPMLAITNR